VVDSTHEAVQYLLIRAPEYRRMHRVKIPNMQPGMKHLEGEMLLDPVDRPSVVVDSMGHNQHGDH
jgi:hypothetical protein